MKVYACEDDDQDMLSITDWAEGEYKIACFNSDDEVNVILSKERVEQLIGDLKELIKGKRVVNKYEIEKEIQDKGLNAPRLNPEKIDRVIESAEYYVFGGVLTVCCLTLSNGFKVTGESSCASPENFDEEIGIKISYKNARDKVWMLEGYLLKERLHEQKANKPSQGGK